MGDRRYLLPILIACMNFMTSFAVKDCTCGHAEDVDAAPVNMPRIFNIEKISMIPSQCTAFRFHSEMCLENLAWKGGGYLKK